MWRSIGVDAMPSGAYELKLKAEATGNEPIQLKVAIEPGDRPQAPLLSQRPRWSFPRPAPTARDNSVDEYGAHPSGCRSKRASMRQRPAARLSHQSYAGVADCRRVASLLRAEFCGSARPIANQSGNADAGPAFGAGAAPVLLEVGTVLPL